MTTGSGELPAHISYSILPERPSSTKRKVDAQRGPGFKRPADAGSPLQVCAQHVAPLFRALPCCVAGSQRCVSSAGLLVVSP